MDSDHSDDSDRRSSVSKNDLEPLQPVNNPCMGLPECTDEQLRAAGYIRPQPVYPPNPRDPNPETRNEVEPAPVYKSNISIRCLEPPCLPPGQLTVVEVRPPAPPDLPPKVEHTRPPQPSIKPPPLILRERPPPAPPASPDEKCYVYLPRPPPAQQIIRHIWDPCPPKPRDIIIERWLPYKRSHLRKALIEPAPPYNPKTVRDIVIHHVCPEPHIDHQIHKSTNPIPTDPARYVQEHGNELLDNQQLQQILLNELSTQRASDEILQCLQAIFRVPCDGNHEQSGFYGTTSYCSD